MSVPWLILLLHAALATPIQESSLVSGSGPFCPIY